MDYLVYNTAQDAETAQNIIFEFGKQLAQAAGYYVDDDIHGKKNGVSDATTGVTTRWCDVLERLDGKFVILHPKYHPAAIDQDLLAQLIIQLEPISEETKQDNWFPITEEV